MSSNIAYLSELNMILELAFELALELVSGFIIRLLSDFFLVFTVNILLVIFLFSSFVTKFSSSKLNE